MYNNSSLLSWRYFSHELGEIWLALKTGVGTECSVTAQVSAHEPNSMAPLSIYCSNSHTPSSNPCNDCVCSEGLVCIAEDTKHYTFFSTPLPSPALLLAWKTSAYCEFQSETLHFTPLSLSNPSLSLISSLTYFKAHQSLCRELDGEDEEDSSCLLRVGEEPLAKRLWRGGGR